MKSSFIILLASLLIHLTSFSQTTIIDSCGLNNDAALNSNEVLYFNEAFKERSVAEHFNFQDKRILFTSGNWAAMSSSKQHFFESSGKSRYVDGTFPSMQLIVLTGAEKKQFDNHDAILVTWSKLPVSEKNRKKFILNAKKQLL